MTLYLVVNARKRLKNFPVTYFGNYILCRLVECSMADVVDMPMAKLAELVHESVLLVMEEYVRLIVDCIHIIGASNLTWDWAHLATYNLQPIFWRFFPFYKLDFGFGNPRYGGWNSAVLGLTGFAGVRPIPPADRSIMVAVYLFPNAAQRLQNLVAPN